MPRKYLYLCILAVVVCLGIAAYLVIPHSAAARVAGTVTAVDATGMATIKTDDGQEQRMTGEGWKVGDKVECAMQDEKLVCKKS
jgi:hypothetical protein